MSEESSRCPLNMSDWIGGFKTNDNVYHESFCCTFLCCPIKTPIMLLILPCTFYNMCMNKYNNKYIC